MLSDKSRYSLYFGLAYFAGALPGVSVEEARVMPLKVCLQDWQIIILRLGGGMGADE